MDKNVQLFLWVGAGFLVMSYLSKTLNTQAQANAAAVRATANVQANPAVNAPATATSLAEASIITSAAQSTMDFISGL
jgi:hypothetical protein